MSSWSPVISSPSSVSIVTVPSSSSNSTISPKNSSPSTSNPIQSPTSMSSSSYSSSSSSSSDTSAISRSTGASKALPSSSSKSSSTSGLHLRPHHLRMCLPLQILLHFVPFFARSQSDGAYIRCRYVVAATPMIPKLS